MHIRNINTILMLLAGIIVAVYSLLSRYTIERTAYTMILVLVIFFVLGSVLQSVLNRILQQTEVSERELVKSELDEEAGNLEEETPKIWLISTTLVRGENYGWKSQK